MRPITPYDEPKLCNEDTCLNTATHVAYVLVAVVSCDEHLALMRKAIGLVGRVEPTIEEAPRND